MNQFLKVEGHAGLVRDMSTGAILNKNRTEYEEYLERIKQAELKDVEILMKEQKFIKVNIKINE